MNDAAALQDILTFSITTGELLRNLSVALVCGLLVAVFYVSVTGRYSRSREFVNSLVALVMLTAIVIMVIGNNLARAFGLVGAMSIIRFRTAVKDVRDIVFIFFSLTIGMAAGVGLTRVALIGTLFVGLVMLALSRLPRSASTRREYVLQFAWKSPGDETPAYLAVLAQFLAQYHVVSAQSSGEDVVDIAYYIRLKRGVSTDQILKALRAVDGMGSINLLYDDHAG
jgi:hypothetical protein